MLNRNIKTIRESKGLSQKELAEKAGYSSPSAIIAIENGNMNPSYEKIKDIANALDVSIYQLKGTNKLPKAELSDNERFSLTIIAPILDEMTEEEIDHIVYYANNILKAQNKKPKWSKYKKEK